MDALEIHRDERRYKWLILALLLHALFFLILLLPMFYYQEPPPEQQGILVAFGEPDAGDGDVRQQPEQTVEVEKVSPPTSNPTPSEPAPAAPETPVVQDDQAEINFKKAEEERKKAAAEAARKQAAEAERRRAEEEARKKAEAEAQRQKEYEDSKSEFGSLFSGKGNTDNPSGSQGDPNSKSDEGALKGISKGSGRVGGGLSNRGIVYVPDVSENSQETGRVVISICVDNRGNVISASYTQRGSTTQSAALKQKALEAAKKYRFNSSEIEEQCGQVTFEFKVQ